MLNGRVTYTLIRLAGAGHTWNIHTKYVHSVPAKTFQGGELMAKDVIHVDGEDVIVREDTAKAWRGVNWAIISVLGFVLIAAVLFAVFFLRAARDGSVQTPAQAANTNSR